MFARVKVYLPTVFLGVLIFYFGFHALTGERGLLSHQRRKETLQLRTHQLAELKKERADLEARARLLSTHSLSADLLEERARTLLGFVGPGDYVIRLPGQSG